MGRVLWIFVSTALICFEYCPGSCSLHDSEGSLQGCKNCARQWKCCLAFSFNLVRLKTSAILYCSWNQGSQQSDHTIFSRKNMFVCPAGSFRLHLVLHEKMGEKQIMFISLLKISTCDTKGIENRHQVCYEILTLVQIHWNQLEKLHMNCLASWHLHLSLFVSDFCPYQRICGDRFRLQPVVGHLTLSDANGSSIRNTM